MPDPAIQVLHSFIIALSLYVIQGEPMRADETTDHAICPQPTGSKPDKLHQAFENAVKAGLPSRG